MRAKVHVVISTTLKWPSSTGTISAVSPTRFFVVHGRVEVIIGRLQEHHHQHVRVVLDATLKRRPHEFYCTQTMTLHARLE